MTVGFTERDQLDKEYTRSVVVLRWLLVILSGYLTLFRYLESPAFPFVSAFVAGFALSNIACMILPSRILRTPAFGRTLTALDVVFVSLTFYLLRVPETYLYVPFVLVFVMAVFWRDLKVVAFSLIAVSLLYHAFSSMRLYGRYSVASSLRMVAGELGDHIESLLTLSLFFVVAVFYLVLTDRLRQQAGLSAVLLEEKRRAEVMGEITRSLSFSLNSQEILSLIVKRLAEVSGALDCSVVSMNAEGSTGTVLVRSTEAEVKDAEIGLEAYPEFRQAYEERDLVFLPQVVREGVEQSVVVIPMLAQDAVPGLIHIRLAKARPVLDEADERFYKMMALTAANALRNAKLFEEMEHRARTDFLTGLPNHRFFQSTLATELVRAQRHNHPLSLLMVDLDYLKVVNDRFGHPTGDAVIRTVAETIRTSCRDSDFAARYGGEEFAVVLPETPLVGALQVAERIRARINSTVFPGVGTISASIGVSNYPINALGKEDLIRVADQALYVAKNEGRNRVSHFSYQLVTR